MSIVSYYHIVLVHSNSIVVRQRWGMTTVTLMMTFNKIKFRIGDGPGAKCLGGEELIQLMEERNVFNNDYP